MRFSSARACRENFSFAAIWLERLTTMIYSPYMLDIDTSTSSLAFPGGKQSLYIQRVCDHYQFSFESHRKLSRVNGRWETAKKRGARGTNEMHAHFITFNKYQGDTDRKEGGIRDCLRMLIRCWWVNDLMGLSRRIFWRAATSRRVRRHEHRPLYMASDIKL